MMTDVIPPPDDDRPVTDLLLAWRSGDDDALDRLMSRVYQELHGLAAGYMSRERADHTLQPTSLVHEAYLRLVDSDIELKNRVHFFAVAATVMRRVLIDYARARRTAKRDGDLVTLDESRLSVDDRTVDLLALDDALDRLAEHDDRKRRVVEMAYFGGLTYAEIANVLDISAATVDRDLRLAKAWLFKAMGGTDS